VNFALAGLGTSKNAKYDTAVQLYNLERDSGKVYSLEDIEKNSLHWTRNSVERRQKLESLKETWPWATEGNVTPTVHGTLDTLVETAIGKLQMPTPPPTLTPLTATLISPVTTVAKRDTSCRIAWRRKAERLTINQHKETQHVPPLILMPLPRSWCVLPAM
jgi:hypothetical protein